jgi:hypothetical protein
VAISSYFTSTYTPPRVESSAKASVNSVEFIGGILTHTYQLKIGDEKYLVKRDIFKTGDSITIENRKSLDDRKERTYLCKDNSCTPNLNR